MPIVATVGFDSIFRPGNGLPDITNAGVDLTDEQYNLVKQARSRLGARAEREMPFTILAQVGGPPTVEDQGDFATQEFVLTQISQHVNSPTPHPVYDSPEGPTLLQILEEALQ